MNKRSIVAWIPIRTPAWDHPERLSVYEQARDEFLTQLPSVLCTLGNDIEISQVTIARPPKKAASWFKKKNFLNGTKLIEYISVHATVEVDSAWMQANPNIEEDFVLAVAASQLGDKLELVLTLSELAYPGCIDALEGVCISANELVQEINEKRAFSHLSFPEERDPSWPSIKMIAIFKVMAWAQRTGMPTKHIAASRIERALAAYSHVVGLSWLRDGEGLFRAMQGLEAFYSDGIGDLRKQLSEKIQLWLGAWRDERNIVGHLYDLRSAFIHGSARLVFWGSEGGAWDEDENAMHKFDGSVKLAIRLLVATLQRCVTDDIVDIKWSYSFEAGPPANNSLKSDAAKPRTLG